MNNRQIKKIIKTYGRWYPVDDNFKKYPDTMEVTFFSCGGWERGIPQRKLNKFWPYNVHDKIWVKLPYIYGIKLCGGR